MASGRTPIITRSNHWIDDGTTCRHASPCPGPIGLSAARSLVLKGPILVGKAKRDPGFNFDGTPAEDMQYADAPAKSAAIRSDPVFSQSDKQLNDGMRSLMQSLSIGAMEGVALQMQKKFSSGSGGVFSSDVLNKEIANNSAFVSYHRKFLSHLKSSINHAGMDPRKITKIAMDLLNFSSFWDKVSGLGITVHQVWSVKAELFKFHLDGCTGSWSGELVYTFYDHFGLDWEDIVKNGDRILPQYHTGDYFKAWYILQHYRNAKPFITQMTRKVVVVGGP
ncbi:MAG: DUF3289 family protein [Candidatus Thiodiazotropha sp.]